jgi:hypothetical protein
MFRPNEASIGDIPSTYFKTIFRRKCKMPVEENSLIHK